jgi:hypothetical protein
MKNLFVSIFCCLLIILGGCSSFTNEEFYEEWDFSTPTRDNSVVREETRTPTITVTKSPTVAPVTLEATQPQTSYIKIYAEGLNPNWGLINGNQEEINLLAQAESYDGYLSIAIMPTKSYSNISFIVKESSKERYPLFKILGIRFWINPEDYDLSPSNLGLKILGSNELSYFVIDKNSVSSSGNANQPITSLDELGYNKTITANNWTEFVVLFDNLANSPDHENLVGFSISNDSGFLQTIYMDQVELILAAGETIPTRAPTSTYTKTPIPTNTATVSPTPSATSTPTQSNITPYIPPEPTSTKKPKPKPTKAPTKKPIPTLAP